MIHNRELQIGNLVKHGFMYYEITKISSSHVSLMKDKFILNDIPLHRIYQVYLSEKWLLKSGFIQDQILFEKGNFAVKKWEVGGTIQWIFFLGQTKILEIKDISLHKFSNIYFIITGELLDFGDF